MVENDLTVKLKFKYVIKKFVIVKVRLQSFNEYWILKNCHPLILLYLNIYISENTSFVMKLNNTSLLCDLKSLFSL